MTALVLGAQEVLTEEDLRSLAALAIDSSPLWRTAPHPPSGLRQGSVHVGLARDAAGTT